MDNISCILTVIKDEQEYLDEWIKYHLDLGVDHIFIFEDIDSTSHIEICSRYNRRVTLDSVLSILDKKGRDKAFELKLTKKSNAQDLYFKNGLKYIKEKFKNVYDWCFVIDVDEYITLEKENTKLIDVFGLFDKYDAFVMQWKCYGANGYINKPDYSVNGIVGTYTKKSDYIGHSVLEWTTKTCYKLSAFKENYFIGNHQPSDDCKWCRTNFTKNRKSPIYNTIYIRHYITKSWEEYIQKRKRGYFMGFARTSDMFFKVNPDMLNIKKELMNKLKDEILVVLPYKQSGSQGNEIKLCLNGWRKYCQFNYHLIVIGEFNNALKDEFPWVEFIYCPSVPKKPNQYNPHLDIQNKFKTVSKMYSQIYDGFIYLTDDEYAIKPFVLSDITKVYCHSFNFTGDKKAPTSYWNYDKWKTRQLLDKYNLPHINYTTHYPCWFEFKKFDEIQKKFDMLKESYVFDDVYFNYFEHDEPILDSKIRLGIWSKEIYERDFQKAIENPNIKFMCNSVEGWCKELENDLEKIVK